jgi:hypothetical protein
MSKSNTWENDLLLLLFNNTNASLIGDATGLRGSSTAGSLYVSLHSSDPGEAGTQSTNEVAYTSYARVAVARSAGGWTVSGNTVTNTAAVNWPAATGGSATATHFAIGTDVSGAGKLLYKGALTASLAISSGITPSAAIGALSVSEE